MQLFVCLYEVCVDFIVTCSLRLKNFLKILIIMQITGLAMAPSGLMATSCVDGCVRVWTLRSKELALQFEVKDQVRGILGNNSIFVYLVTRV